MVTGAASGIGRATSLLLAARGCELAIADVNEPELTETARLITETGQRVSTHVVDVSNKQRMQRFADEVVEVHGRVNVIVNNAGVSVTSTFENQSLEDFEWLFGINFWGVVYGCKFFMPLLQAADEAHIVNISSVFGILGVPLNSSYCASKFAVRGFSESLRAELAGSSVGVTSVHPGGIATNIVRSARFGSEQVLVGLKERSIRAFARMLPPEKAAAAIVEGIEKNSGRVLITREAYAIDAAKRLFPAWSSELVGRNWRNRIAKFGV